MHTVEVKSQSVPRSVAGRCNSYEDGKLSSAELKTHCKVSCGQATTAFLENITVITAAMIGGVQNG